jgi:hypothetical protein
MRRLTRGRGYGPRIISPGTNQHWCRTSECHPQGQRTPRNFRIPCKPPGTADRSKVLDERGQPGRIAILEEDVETLQGWKQQLVEIGTAVSAIRSTVVSAVVWALEHFDIIHFF